MQTYLADLCVCVALSAPFTWNSFHNQNEYFEARYGLYLSGVPQHHFNLGSGPLGGEVLRVRYSLRFRLMAPPPPSDAICKNLA